jgi:hypothetical protein
MRRFILAEFMALLCCACSAWSSSPIALVAGLAAAGGLLAGPVHGRALKVARRTGCVLDYPLAILLALWVALAGAWGWRLGKQDRHRQAHVFVRRLVDYWGAESVAEVPPWAMKDVPIPTTVVVSWHWPPRNRASANVLATLFDHASPESYQVLTRALSPPPEQDHVVPPALSTWRVAWPLSDDDLETNWVWPASVWTAVRMVLQARRMYRARPFTRILAVHPHRYGLLAGWLASRFIGMPLVAYMHDLMVETILTRRWSKRAFWRLIDRAALAHAELVIVPTEEFADHYRRRGIGNTWVLPHCLPGDLTASPATPTDGLIKLAYSGSVYQAHEQAVAALVRALNELDDVEFSAYGNPHRAWGHVQVDRVPRSQLSDRLREADVLVVALAADAPYPRETQGCFPSKIVDYLAIGRPILAVAPAGSFVDRLVTETACGLSVTSYDPADIAGAVDMLRDPEIRQGMAEAARDLADHLSPRQWINLLGKRLAYLHADVPGEEEDGFDRQVRSAADLAKLSDYPTPLLPQRTAQTSPCADTACATGSVAG